MKGLAINSTEKRVALADKVIVGLQLYTLHMSCKLCMIPVRNSNPANLQKCVGDFVVSYETFEDLGGYFRRIFQGTFPPQIDARTKQTRKWPISQTWGASLNSGVFLPGTKEGEFTNSVILEKSIFPNWLTNRRMSWFALPCRASNRNVKKKIRSGKWLK